MKNFLFCLFTLLSAYCAYSQDITKFHLYKPGENAEKEITKIVKEAKAGGQTYSYPDWRQLVYMVCKVP